MTYAPSPFARTLVAPLLALLALASLCGPARAGDPPPTHKARVLVLGLYHFDNPNQDYVKTDVDDHLSARRQAEIAEVADLVAEFKPTKIVIEAVDGKGSLDRDYASYLKGGYTLTADERDQVGFRLAKRLGHTRLYAVDERLDMDLDRVVAAAQKSNDHLFLDRLQAVLGELQEFEKRKRAMTVREILSTMNSPAEIAKTHDLYLAMARVRSGDGTFDGADVLADWYRRNFRIFSNIARVADSPDDRVLVLYGAGHLPYFREQIAASSDLELVDAGVYLDRRAPRR